MTSTQRRLYLLFFVGLFLVTAPVLVLFAQGYRFDRQGRIFVYSGSITVKSWPRDIDIYVNNKKQDKKKLNAINSSYTINGVRPGKYEIRCEKEGYTSWAKTIEVHSGVSTEMWNVVLFPKAKQGLATFSSENMEQIFLSPRDENELLFLSEEEDGKTVSLIDTGTNEVEKIYETTDFEFMKKDKKENIEWSSDKKRILIPFEKNGEKIFIIARIRRENLRDIVELNSIFQEGLEIYESRQSSESESAETESAQEAEESIAQPVSKEDENEQQEKPLSEQFEKVRWMFDKNDELVVLTKDHKLYYINIENPEKMILLDDEVSGFDFAGNRIYYTRLPNNIVWEIKNDNIDTKRQITNTPIPTEEKKFLKLFAYDQYRIAIITEKEELYLYNNEKEENEISTEKLVDGVSDIQFSDDGKKLLYWTNNEAWLYMLRDWDVQPTRKKGEKIFITRFSHKLRNVQWMDDYENIIFSTGKTIKSASIDTRGHANVADIMELTEEIDERDVFYNKTNQKLFLLTKENKTTALQSMLLIDKTGFLGF